MYVNVKGGTRAGWRVLRAAASDWRCPGCGAKNRYYWLRCPNIDCKHPRPEKEGN